MSAAIVLFAHQPFRRVFLDKTALIRAVRLMPRFVFDADLSLGPRAAAAGAIAFLARATKDSYAVDCATPALSRILLNHLRPANGWLGCRTRTFLNILP